MKKLTLMSLLASSFTAFALPFNIANQAQQNIAIFKENNVIQQGINGAISNNMADMKEQLQTIAQDQMTGMKEQLQTIAQDQMTGIKEQFQTIVQDQVASIKAQIIKNVENFQGQVTSIKAQIIKNVENFVVEHKKPLMVAAGVTATGVAVTGLYVAYKVAQLAKRMCVGTYGLFFGSRKETKALKVMVKDGVLVISEDVTQ